jgi:DNA mismatch repair protein MutL
MTAFEGLLPESTFPFYVLFIEIDPKHIDVNVHPTKTEIKFDDERAVYAVVLSAVRQAIGTHNLTPAIDFDADVNIIAKLSQSANQSKEVYFEERFGTELQRSNRDHWEKLFITDDAKNIFHQPVAPTSQLHTLRFESALNQPGNSETVEEKIVCQLHNRYIIRQVRSGMMIIDQQAAHERILFEKFLNQYKSNSNATQQSLFPQAITFSAADYTLVSEMQPEIEALGFKIEVFGKNTFIVNGIPGNVPMGREKELFEGLIEQFKTNQSELAIPIRENLARSLARRASLKSGQKLEREEMQSLVDNLFGCATPNYAPDGRPTFFIFGLNKIESYFR